MFSWLRCLSSDDYRLLTNRFVSVVKDLSECILQTSSVTEKTAGVFCHHLTEMGLMFIPKLHMHRRGLCLGKKCFEEAVKKPNAGHVFRGYTLLNACFQNCTKIVSSRQFTIQGIKPFCFFSYSYSLQSLMSAVISSM